MERGGSLAGVQSRNRCDHAGTTVINRPEADGVSAASHAAFWPNVIAMSSHPFEVICEIEPPTGPDLTHARHQIGVLSPVADAFLIPDNHIGRATVSSIAVAHEVQAMGGNTIACLNSRDRNLLGFRRDLLTAAAYGVSQFLFVYGDKPSSGGRTSDLTVRSMIEEARNCSTDPVFTGVAPWRIGAAASLRPLPRWKHGADFLFTQVSYSAEAQLRWRDANPADIPVYAGVMVLASTQMARRLAASIPDIDIPRRLIDRVAADKNAGVDAACEQIRQLRDSGAFQGVHLVPVSRYREVSARLEDVH
jgi:methylenetetrahydrofolate reductase (NADPH)